MNITSHYFYEKLMANILIKLLKFKIRNSKYNFQKICKNYIIKCIIMNDILLFEIH